MKLKLEPDRELIEHAHETAFARLRRGVEGRLGLGRIELVHAGVLHRVDRVRGEVRVERRLPGVQVLERGDAEVRPQEADFAHLVARNRRRRGERGALHLGAGPEDPLGVTLHGIAVLGGAEDPRPRLHRDVGGVVGVVTVAVADEDRLGVEVDQLLQGGGHVARRVREPEDVGVHEEHPSLGGHRVGLHAEPRDDDLVPVDPAVFLIDVLEAEEVGARRHPRPDVGVGQRRRRDRDTENQGPNHECVHPTSPDWTSRRARPKVGAEGANPTICCHARLPTLTRTHSLWPWFRSRRRPMQ